MSQPTHVPVTRTVPLCAPGAAGHTAGLQVSAIRSVRLVDGTLADLVVAGGQITAVLPAGAPRPAGPLGATGIPTGTATGAVELDAHGWRVIPAASEPHAHLDKALSGERVDYFSGTTQNDLAAAIEQWRGLLATIDEADIRDRATRAVERYVSRGITSIRTHVDFPLTGDPLRGLKALTAVRDALAGVMTIQVVGLAGQHTPDAVIEDAISLGLDVIGGCPHISEDPHRETTRMLDLAERTGLPVDLHTDEQTNADELDIVDLAHQVIARDLGQLVTASHCVRLGSLPPERLHPVLDLVARSGMGIVTLPITNLYLQGWDATHLAPRGLTAVRAILDAGIPLAAGADNLRDPFNPVGRADPFETTSLLITAGHLTPVEALAAVTTGARTVLGLPAVLDVGPGRAPFAEATPVAADLILVPDVDLGDVLAGAVDARVVLHGGRVLADTRTSRTLDLSQRSPSTPIHPAKASAGIPDRPVLEHVR
ncbi:cytosine deaminase [Sanguibacter gelidistatuariae]|uniref:Cytosine deaminase n=1 Tax=Sanguibacter gelidistatuariae TaxID=1814289 RepID=A0A1G6GR57_9MICO|nr:amidohydrolase family protein [Sanguibacter gelidistatuariae]SDB84532.1 cytosine deaminase [Sanguibacter gelidistatuariae]